MLHILSSDLSDVLQGLSVEHIGEFGHLVLRTTSLGCIGVLVPLPFLLILQHFWVLNDCAGKMGLHRDGQTLSVDVLMNSILQKDIQKSYFGDSSLSATLLVCVC